MSAPSVAPLRVSPLERARRAAAEAAGRARIDVVPLHGAGDSHRAADLISAVWQVEPDRPPLAPNTIRAIEHSGGYLHGALGPQGELRGVSVGFLGLHEGRSCLHSHITGVLAGGRGRGLGAALKTHQRVWCLERGIDLVTWTFDPLVRRNAHFNLQRLGARAVEYVEDFYGPMTDGLNRGDATDRLSVVWDLASEPATPDPRPALRVLRVGPDGGPEVPGEEPGWAGGPRAVALPADVEALRADRPDLAARWRSAVRDALGGLLQSGWRVTGFADDLGYLVACD